MNTSGVYVIRNVVNGKRYVGSSVDIGRRISDHFDDLRKGVHRNNKLQRAFDKYGELAFTWDVLAIVPNVRDLVEFEQAFMDGLRPEYNLSPTAGSNLGHRYSEEIKQRLRESVTPERRKLLSELRSGPGNGMYGRRHDPRAVIKIREASIARTNRPETQAALAKGHGWNRGVPFGTESRRRMSAAKDAVKRCVVRVCPKTGRRKTYPSLRSVKADGFHPSHVADCCKGRVRMHMNYRWRYGA